MHRNIIIKVHDKIFKKCSKKKQIHQFCSWIVITSQFNRRNKKTKWIMISFLSLFWQLKIIFISNRLKRYHTVRKSRTCVFCCCFDSFLCHFFYVYIFGCCRYCYCWACLPNYLQYLQRSCGDFILNQCDRSTFSTILPWYWMWRVFQNFIYSMYILGFYVCK